MGIIKRKVKVMRQANKSGVGAWEGKKLEMIQQLIISHGVKGQINAGDEIKSCFTQLRLK